MLTEDTAVDVLHIYVEVLCKAGAKSCGVKNGSGTDYLLLGKSGMLAEGIGQDIDRIADDNINGIGSSRGNLRNDALCDVNIRLSKIKTGLTGTSCDTGGNDNDIRASCVGIITGIYIDRSDVGSTLTDIPSLRRTPFSD